MRASAKPQPSHRRKRHACWNSGPRVRTAASRCLPTRFKHASARTSARFARRASTAYWPMCVRTAAADSFQGPSGRRGTGRGTISWARTPQAARSATGRSIRKRTRGSQTQSSGYPLMSARRAIRMPPALCRARHGVRGSDGQPARHPSKTARRASPSTAPSAPMTTMRVPGARAPHRSVSAMSTRLPTTCSTPRTAGSSTL